MQEVGGEGEAAGSKAEHNLKKQRRIKQELQAKEGEKDKQNTEELEKEGEGVIHKAKRQKLTRQRQATLELQEGECVGEGEDEADVGGNEDESQKEKNMAEI